MTNSRRDFLKLAGGAAVGAAGLAALAGCDPVDVYARKKPAVPGGDGWRLGEEKFITSVCGQCFAGCGIKVRVVEGRAIKNEGNHDCPLNKGGLGPKGQSGLQMLYHPDRVKGPMKQAARGSGQWTPISWADAIKEIAQKLNEIRGKQQAQGVAVIDGDPRGPMHDLWERFLSAYGSPNLIDHRSVTDGGKVLAMKFMQGVNDLPAYDWENTKFVIGFGSTLFESWCQSIYFTRAAAHLKQGIPGRRVKIVQVAPRFSITSAKADEWVPINPATYGALALGLGHVLIRDELYDKPFVQEHTFGFEDWTDDAGVAHRGYKTLLLEDYKPEKVSTITGVPVATIENLARQMSVHSPALAFADGQAASATNGLGTAMAIHSLNALLGNCERPGGVWVQRKAPLTPWAAVALDEVAQTGAAMPRLDGAGSVTAPLSPSYIQALPACILAGKPYPIQALFLYKSNPLYSKPAAAQWKEAIQKVPLVVSFSPLKDESTLFADYLLPEGTYLERWELVEPVPNLRYPFIGVRQPVVDPLYDVRSTGDVIISLAQAIGGDVAKNFPWKSYKLALIERLKGIFAKKSGSVVEDKFATFGLRIQEKGGWWDDQIAAEDWATGFQTPSGKFEFYSQIIAKQLAALKPDELAAQLTAAGVATSGDNLCMPHWEAPKFQGDAKTYPFMLVPYRGVEYAEGGARHLPWLMELPLQGRNAWREQVDINPKTAHELELHEGDWVEITTPAGNARLSVRLATGVEPNMIGLPLGHGTWPPTADTIGKTGGYGLIANISDPMAGVLSLQETRAAIRKVSG